MAKSKVHTVYGSLTTAQVNAGTLIADGRTGKSIAVVGGCMTATGSADTATSVAVKDTSDVVAVACGVAGLTNGAQLGFDAASNVTRTTYRTALTAGKGIKIDNTGSSLGTTTAVAYYVEYIYV
jgi:hypothetical protein